MELLWVKAQREKQGSKSKFVITSVDKQITQKQERYLKCQEFTHRERGTSSIQQIENNNEEECYDNVENSLENESKRMIDERTIDLDENDERPRKRVRKTSHNFNIAAVAECSLRFGTSAAATAAIINSTIASLADMGYVGDNFERLFCDKNKVLRAKNSVLKKTLNDEISYLQKDITGWCIYYYNYGEYIIRKYFICCLDISIYFNFMVYFYYLSFFLNRCFYRWST